MKIVKLSLLFLSLFLLAKVSAETVVIDNQTFYPSKGQSSTIVLQWARSAREVNEDNNALIQETPIAKEKMKPLTQNGKITVNLPPDAMYFRILVWSKNDSSPDLHTNWVNVVSNKTYTVKQDQLVPTVLMSGVGC